MKALPAVRAGVVHIERAAIRHALLDAIGATPLRLRSRPAPGDAVTSAEAGAEDAALVVVCAVHERDAARSALHALGLGVDTAVWLSPDAHGALVSPPLAPNYLVLGEPLARKLGAQLPTAQQQAVRIVVAAAPAQWRDAAAKRRLWQALKPLVRALRSR